MIFRDKEAKQVPIGGKLLRKGKTYLKIGLDMFAEIVDCGDFIKH